MKYFLFIITFGFLVYLIFYNLSLSLENKGYKAYKISYLAPRISENKVQTTPTPTKRIYPPGVITGIGNGLGNQLFRVASSYTLARELNIPLYWIIEEGSQVNMYRKLRNPSYRAYGLDAFELASSKIKIYLVPAKVWGEIWQTAKYSKYTCINFFIDRVNKTIAETRLIHLGDYCHSELYFEEYSIEIKDLLKVKETYLNSTSKQFRNWKKEIERKGGRDSTSTAIHIRLGDYVEKSRKDTWPTPFSFYTEAISKMVESFCNKTVTFYIFSDSIGFVKQKLNASYKPTVFGREKNCTNYPEFVYISPEWKDVGAVDGLTSIEEFLLMTLCENIIISNSSFSWWAAYLNNNVKKIVIGPTFNPNFFAYEGNKLRKRFRSFMLAFKYPKTWITLDPFNGTGL